jgi:hypothetical protein
MAAEKLAASIADPCCGKGAVLNVLKGAGHIVFGADIRDYGWPHTIVRDYLTEPVEMGCVGIVTNPPYRLALQFIQKAISDGCQYHAWLLRLNFLESMTRKAFFEFNPPAAFTFFAPRSYDAPRGPGGPTIVVKSRLCLVRLGCARGAGRKTSTKFHGFASS